MPLVQQTTTVDVDFNDVSYSWAGQVLTTQEFKDQFLWGIPLCNTTTGQTLPDYVIQQKLLAAQKFVENFLDLKLFIQYVEEQRSFVREEYINWAYVKASYPINKPYYIIGRLNERQVLQYPNSWITIRRKRPADYSYSKNMNLVPNGNSSTVTFDFLATINNQWFSYYGARIIPEYWFLQYLTGFDVIPPDIIQVIGKQAALEVLPLIEFTVGAGSGFVYGAASNSLSMDGLSQSISKANGGNIFRQRLEQYRREVELQLQQLKNSYAGFVFEVA